MQEVIALVSILWRFRSHGLAASRSYRQHERSAYADTSVTWGRFCDFSPHRGETLHPPMGGVKFGVQESTECITQPLERYVIIISSDVDDDGGDDV